MDPGEIFKRFFGTSFPEFSDRPFSPADDKKGFGRPEDSDERDLFGFDVHVHMQQHLEEMEDFMQKVFQFPHYSPSDEIHLHEGWNGKKPGSTARDEMLKDGEKAPPSQMPAQPSRPRFGRMFLPLFEAFPGTPRLNRIPPEERLDRDLDKEKPNSEEIVDILEQHKKPVPFTFGSNRVDIKAIFGADGVVEERRTVRDSNGCEETTVTRRIGDSSHTVTTRKDENGFEERREVFQNCSKDKIPELEKHWQGKVSSTVPVLTDPKTAQQVPSSSDGLLSDNRGFFRKFFGF